MAFHSRECLIGEVAMGSVETEVPPDLGKSQMKKFPYIISKCDFKKKLISYDKYPEQF